MKKYIFSKAYELMYAQQKSIFNKENPNWRQHKVKKSFVNDNSFLEEIKAAVAYRTAKAKGVILVSQTW